MDKPYYPNKPIASIDALAKTIGIIPNLLVSIADKVDDSYTSYELKPHPKTGKIRTVFEAKYELKRIQKLINSRIFESVEFPTYLQGGIKSDDKRDYVKNSKIHSRAETLISLDIKNFYTNIKSIQVENVFKYFFNFSDDVTSLLTKLTTYNGVVPQGGCTSSYIANLIFFNSEYRLVSSFSVGRQLSCLV